MPAIGSKQGPEGRYIGFWELSFAAKAGVVEAMMPWGGALSNLYSKPLTYERVLL